MTYLNCPKHGRVLTNAQTPTVCDQCAEEAVMAPLAADVQPIDADREADAIEAVNSCLKNLSIKHVEECVRQASSLLQAGPRAAARAMHLIEGVAAINSQMLTLVGATPKKRRRKLQGPLQSSIMGYGYGAGSYMEDDYEDDVETFTGNASAETFGNKALQQIVSIFKPLISQGGLLGLASKPTGPAKASEIEALMRAMVEAKKAGLGTVYEKINAKLDAALADPADVAATPEPVPAPEVTP